MSKNITIAEGDTAKNFTADKIVTSLVDGGTQNWIPEDEAAKYAKLKSKTIKESGVYKAEDDNLDGYSSVTVQLETEMKSKTIKANGEYHAVDDRAAGYDVVTVDVPSGVDIKGVEIKATAASNLKMGDSVIVTSPNDDGLSLLRNQQYSGYYDGGLFLTESGKLYNNKNGAVLDIYSGSTIKTLSPWVRGEYSSDGTCYSWVKSYSESDRSYMIGVILKDDTEIEINLDMSDEFIYDVWSDSIYPVVTYYNNLICVTIKNDYGTGYLVTAAIFDKNGNLLNQLSRVTAGYYSGIYADKIYCYAVNESEVIGVANTSSGASPYISYYCECIHLTTDRGERKQLFKTSVYAEGRCLGCIDNYLYFGDNKRAEYNFYHKITVMPLAYPPSDDSMHTVFEDDNLRRVYGFDPYYKQCIMGLYDEDDKKIKYKVVNLMGISELYKDTFQDITTQTEFLQNSDVLVWQNIYQKSADKLLMSKTSAYPKDGTNAKLGIVKNDVAAGNVGTAVVLFT